MNITTEIIGLDAVPEKPWDGGVGGPTWFIQGRFKNGMLFSRGAKSLDNARTLHFILEGFIGKTESYEIEDTGREYQGAKKVKLVSWPGKPEQPRGGPGGGKGSGSFVPRFRDTEEGARQERDSIHRSVALQQAVILLKDKTYEQFAKTSGILGIADDFYHWLTEPTAASQAAPKPGPAGEPENTTDAPAAAPVHSGGVVCPHCGMADPKIVLEDRDEKWSFFCWKKKGGCGAKFTKIEALQKQLGLQTGDQVQTAVDRYRSEIKSAEHAKDTPRLQKLFGLIAGSVQKGTVSQSECDTLEQEIKAARLNIESAERF
jgi:hypothetical protein